MGKQIDKLAAFIIHEVPGEPSTSESAVDTAIRIIKAQHREIEFLNARVLDLGKFQSTMTDSQDA
jgi:hypothetical protein